MQYIMNMKCWVKTLSDFCYYNLQTITLVLEMKKKKDVSISEKLHSSQITKTFTTLNFGNLMHDPPSIDVYML